MNFQFLFSQLQICAVTSAGRGFVTAHFLASMIFTVSPISYVDTAHLFNSRKQ